MDPSGIIHRHASSLDSEATALIEERIAAMKEHHGIILVTHDLEQARRVTDHVACLCAESGFGEVIESGCCDAVISSDACRQLFQSLGRSRRGSRSGSTGLCGKGAVNGRSTRR